MVHHQGMSLLTLVNVLGEFPMQRRFMACPMLQATELLLQERVPKAAGSVVSKDLKLEESRKLPGSSEAVMRVFTNPTLPAPEVHLLSNGSYHVVISSAGGGYSRWRDLAVTRWREDSTRDCLGVVCLPARSGDGGVLVRRLPAHLVRDDRLRSYLHPGSGGISATTCRS